MASNWFKRVVFYQIYPRSFCDSNGDGIGDIQGIISKLDYLKGLGIGAVWLSPVYKSPNKDFGYDISDYREINPEYGTLDDMKQLFAEAKKRDIKVVMDLVINHTSSEHRWFKEAQDPSSPYHDYYIWKDPKKDKLGREIPPNNWRSYFSGSAWEKNETTGKYYLHIFGKHQPDLNYRNPKVIEEVKDVMRFWLDMGADGFRCDVINIIYKDSFEDGTGNFTTIVGSEHYYSTEGSVRILKEIQRDVLRPYGAFTVGETTGVTIDAANRFINEGCLDTVFSFDHMATDEWRIPLFKVKYSPEKMKKSLIKWQQAVGWNALFFENHDQHRSVSRFGDVDRYHDESAKMLATVLLTLKGSPFVYQGQEIGMTNNKFKSMSEVKDIDALNTYQTMQLYGIVPPLAKKLAMNICRDHARTPMQWSSDEPSGGFSSSDSTWLPVNRNFRNINVASQLDGQDSINKYYTDLIKLRNSTNALQVGDVEVLDSHSQVLAYTRHGEETISVVANLTGKYLPAPEGLQGEVLMSNYSDDHGKGLRPFEATIYRQS